MSAEQREKLDAAARQSAFPVDSDVHEQRRLMHDLMSSQPQPAGATVTEAELGGVRTAEIDVEGIEPRHVVLYFHGGVYAMGDAFVAADRELLQAAVASYASGQDLALGVISPIFADLSGLPPLIIQAGTHEVLLDDAVRLARQVAAADVEVTLDIPAGVPHVFQSFTPCSTKLPPH